MKNQPRYMAVAIVMAMALVVGTTGCGSDATGSTANITFRSEPAAELWIDGTAKGNTPVVVALEKGSHEVTFRAPGFADTVSTIAVEAGKDLSVGAVLTVAGTGEMAVAKVAEALGIEHAPFEKPKVHRGSSNNAIMLYWPKKKIRKEGLTSYRIDVTEDYEGDGFIEFRKGRDVLHREPLNPTSFEVVGTIPESVREAVKRGSRIKWGVYFESKRKKPVTATAQIVDGAKFERRMQKLERRKFFQQQPDIIKERMRNRIFQSSDLHSEGLVHSLGVARRHPKSTIPFEDMITNARRLDLKDTPLWNEASQYVMGGGIGRRAGGAAGGNTSGMGAGVGSGPGGVGGLPPVFLAPQVSGGSVVVDRPTESGFAKKGMGPGDAVEVQPTPTDQKREPGPITDDTGGGTMVDPNADAAARAAVVADLQRQLAEAEDAAKRAEDAESALNDARAELEQAANATSAAEAAREDVQRRLEENPPTATDADLQAAEQALNDARLNHEGAEQAARDAEAAARKVLESTGSSAEARAAADELKRQIEAAQSQVPPGTSPPTVPAPTGSGKQGNTGAADPLQAHADLAKARQEVARLEGEIDAANARASDASLTQAERDAASQQVQDLLEELKKATDKEAGLADGTTPGPAGPNAALEQARLRVAQIEDAIRSAESRVNDTSLTQAERDAASQEVHDLQQDLQDATKAADAAAKDPGSGKKKSK